MLVARHNAKEDEYECVLTKLFKVGLGVSLQSAETV